MQPAVNETQANHRPRVREAHIRQALRADLTARHEDESDTRIIDEFECARSRVDVAVVNGALHGFEIKSEADTLDRLRTQVPSYNSVFDAMTLVVAPKHLAKVGALLPDWWGIVAARTTPDGVRLDPVRPGGRNVSVDAKCLARLLVRSEVLSILRTLGLGRSLGRAPAFRLRERLVTELPLTALARHVRDAIKGRACVEPAEPRIPCDDSCTTAPTAAARQTNRDWLLSLRFPGRPC
jgi:hypothetical protein